MQKHNLNLGSLIKHVTCVKRSCFMFYFQHNLFVDWVTGLLPLENEVDTKSAVHGWAKEKVL